MKLKRVLALGFVGALGLSSAAAADSFRCLLDDVGKNGNWLDRDIVIELTGDKTAMIHNDYIVQRYTGKRSGEAKISRNTDKMLVVTWSIMTRSGTSASKHKQDVRMDYRASYRKRDGQFRFTAKPLGFSNSWYSSGNCEKS